MMLKDCDYQYLEKLLTDVFYSYVLGSENFDRDLREVFKAFLPGQNITPIRKVAKVFDNSN